MPSYLLEFFEAAGLLVLEGYGLTETVAPVAVNRAESYRFGTVGQLIPGMEARIASDGELLLRGKGRFQGYYKDPEATPRHRRRGVVPYRGYRRSGREGFLSITDRKKDLIVTAVARTSPQNLENLCRTLL
jgi:long-chain acyl-CoA synthetase